MSGRERCIDWRPTTHRDQDGETIYEYLYVCERCRRKLGWYKMWRYGDTPPRYCAECHAALAPRPAPPTPPLPEPPIERLLRERAGLLTGLLLAAAMGLVFIAVFGRGEGAGAVLCPASLFALAALLPGWFLVRRRVGGGQALVCGPCEKPQVTESFDELMAKYKQAWGNPREQREIIARAAAVAQASDNLMQMVQVSGMLAEWEQNHGG